MQAIVVSSSRLRYVLLLFGALGFVTAGILMILYAPAADRWIGWASVAFFGSGVVVFARQIIDARPRLIIDNVGVLDRTLGIGRIPWSQIVGARLVSIQRVPFISLSLRDPDRWLQRLSPIGRAIATANAGLGLPPFNLNLAAVDADPEQVLQLVLQMIGLHSDGNSPQSTVEVPEDRG